MMLNTIKLT